MGNSGLWPSGADFRGKLWGSKEELQTTAKRIRVSEGKEHTLVVDVEKLFCSSMSRARTKVFLCRKCVIVLSKRCKTFKAWLYYILWVFSDICFA